MVWSYSSSRYALSPLTSRIAPGSRRTPAESRATLYLLGRELAGATTTDQIVAKVVSELERSFGAEVAVLLPDARNQLKPHKAGTLEIGYQRNWAAKWVF